MKIKLSKIVNSVPAFKTVVQQVTVAKTAFRMSKILNVLQDELDVFEQTKNNIVQKYQTTDENNNLILTDENAEIVKKDIIELLNEEIELNIQPIHINDIPASLNISISNMMLIDYIFTD